MSAAPTGREHDLVVFGATGFVGRLLAEELATHAPPRTRIALAGRSRARLEAVRAGLPGEGATWPVVVADAASADDMAALARSTTAVVTTVGPYLRYGLPLARACAEAGTHYADLTGEVLFVRRVADELHQIALGTGARVVNACGYDSVPSDLAVMLVHQRAQADGAGDLRDTTLLAKARGGLSGGTIDSARAQLDAVGADRSLLKVVFDPYALSPDRASEPDLGDERDVRSVFREADTGQWVGPFVMAPFNTRIVRRSNALQGHAYGRRFRYREVMAHGRGRRGQARATLFSAGLGAAYALLGNPRTRPWFDRVAPKPGEGPDEAARRAGWFEMRVRSTTDSGRRYQSRVAAQGDPGYAATAVMLAQAALALALDGDRLPPAAGVLTPVTGLGTVLVDRLRARGFTMSVEELPGHP